MRTHRILKALISAVNCNQIFPRLLIFRIYPKPRDFYQQFIFLWKHRRVRRLEKNSKLNCFAVFSLGHGCNQNLLPLISFCFIFQAKNVFFCCCCLFCLSLAHPFHSCVEIPFLISCNSFFSCGILWLPRPNTAIWDASPEPVSHIDRGSICQLPYSL